MAERSFPWRVGAESFPSIQMAVFVVWISLPMITGEESRTEIPRLRPVRLRIRQSVIAGFDPASRNIPVLTLLMVHDRIDPALSLNQMAVVIPSRVQESRMGEPTTE